MASKLAGWDTGCSGIVPEVGIGIVEVKRGRLEVENGRVEIKGPWLLRCASYVYGRMRGPADAQ
jgi:hypothetical protein